MHAHWNTSDTGLRKGGTSEATPPDGHVNPGSRADDVDCSGANETGRGRKGRDGKGYGQTP